MFFAKKPKLWLCMATKAWTNSSFGLIPFNFYVFLQLLSYNSYLLKKMFFAKSFRHDVTREYGYSR